MKQQVLTGHYIDMDFYIGTNTGTGMRFKTKEEFLKEIEMMINDCIANGGSQFDITVDADASCFYERTDEDDRRGGRYEK